MNESELGKNEELEETSSAELSQSDLDTASELTDEENHVAVTDLDESANQDDEDDDSSSGDHDDDDSSSGDHDDDDSPSGDHDDDEDHVAATDPKDSGHDDDDDEEGDESTEAVVEDNGLRRGDVIEGVIEGTSPTEIKIALPNGVVGIVPNRELEMMSAQNLQELVEGDKIHVYVVNPRNHRGNTILSINHAMEELDWRRAETFLGSKEVYDAQISGYNKGGLIVRFGRLRGFVPQSQISETRFQAAEGETPEQRYGPMVHQPISVKVMEVDRERNRLILSERIAIREVRQRNKESLIQELNEGEIREGTVVSLESFGAFVDIGGAEGLVHLTELTHKHITHPRQVLNIGETVKVKVINIDEEANRIGLSIKQLISDPWDEVAAQYEVGQLVQGLVTKLTKFGAFARLIDNNEIEGLIHISELSDERVTHPREVVKKGDKLTLRVVKVDIRNRRLGLSLKKVNSPEYLDRDMNFAFDEE
ncbi:hypothetical protein MASR2M15_05730 [Anaerolineales bacterium]